MALPLSLPCTDVFQHDALHYLYLKPHDPKVPDQDSPRSLFLVNIPMSATVASLKHLLSTQLGGGLIETVSFADNALSKPSLASKSSRKRKRKTTEELEAGLDKSSLPDIFDSEINQSGATAIVVFVDTPSMELAFKSAKRAAKSSSPLLWNQGAGAPAARLGLTRYEHHKHLQYPSKKELLRSVNAFMTTYAEMEESRSQENARRRQMPDEDGFVTVTRGSKGSSRMEEAKELAIKHKEKEKSLEDFYRFQTREKRKGQHAEMLKMFEDDKRRVEEMRHQRNRFKVRSNPSLRLTLLTVNQSG